MNTRLDVQRLNLLFQARPDILAGIQNAADTPARISLFNDIASYVFERFSNDLSDEPASKRRKVGEVEANATSVAPAANGTTGAAAAATEPVLLQIKDISVSIPQRKKYDICFTESFFYARASGSAVPVQGIIYAWRDIEHVFYVPVPEKSQAQHNYILFPRSSSLPAKSSNPAGSEPLVFTIPSSAPPKPNTVLGPSAAAAAAVSDSYSSLFHWALASSLRAAGNADCHIVSTDPRVFRSAARQPQRPGEPAVHVKAFRGSKDGFLFFLPTGILWGFKKPLLFLPLDRVVAVSYTSVLQRTFNMVVEVDLGAGTAEELEFSMIDQEDYQGIDQTYVKRHGLQDRSMAEQRKAKRELAENATKEEAPQSDEAAEDGQGGGVPGEDISELDRAKRDAEQKLQDEEDEMEEDYDPGSEGESEGEGYTSEEGDEAEDDEQEEEGGGYMDEDVAEEDEAGDEGDEGDERIDVV